MPAAKTANTQTEILQAILQDLTKAKMTPDADLPFLVDVETQILSYLRKPVEAMAGQLPPYQGQSAQGPPPGMPPGPPGGSGGLGLSPGGPSSAGGPPGAAPGGIPVDELRRVLG